MEENLILPENFTVTIEKASLVLADNKSRVQRATDYGNSLLLNYQKDGVTEATYKAGLEYLSKVSKTVTLINTNRKPVTQFLSDIAKQFTSLEAELSTKDDTVPGQVKNKIDQFAKDIAKKKRELEIIAENKLKKEREFVEAESEALTIINRLYFEYLNDVISQLNRVWEGIDYLTFSNISNDIIEAEYDLPKKYFEGIKHAKRYQFLTAEELSEIIGNAIDSQYPKLSVKFEKEYEQAKYEIIVQFDEKFAELQEIAKSDEKRAEEIKKASAKKAENLAAEQRNRLQESQNAANSELESQKLASNLNSMFDTTPNTSEIKIKEYTEINVLKPSGWIELLLFYFEREGKYLSEDKLEKKFGFAKKFAESVYNKEEVKIDSKFLQYNETAKSK